MVHLSLLKCSLVIVIEISQGEPRLSVMQVTIDVNAYFPCKIDTLAAIQTIQPTGNPCQVTTQQIKVPLN